MTRLHIDIETYCKADISKCGHYRYALDPSFEVLLVCYAWDDEPVQCIDIATAGAWPEWLIMAMSDPTVLKCAHNAAFERVCLSVILRRLGHLGPDEWLEPRQWECSMIRCAVAAIPLSLAEAGHYLALEEQKRPEGKALIKLFCCPVGETGGIASLFGKNRDRVMPAEAPDKWEMFKDYCIRDVEVERNIMHALDWVRIPAGERELYAIDQEINDRGVLVDLPMAGKAVEVDSLLSARLIREAAAITGLDNPNALPQLKGWLSEQLGRSIDKLGKVELQELIRTSGNGAVRRVLQIRAQLGKTSCSKYEAMLRVACADSRARGLTQFYGSRTGRWAGRLIQMQNLPQNHMSDDDLDYARGLLKAGDADLIGLLYGSVPEVMSQLIRTTFLAPEGKTFAVCDFSAIEARVLAWMAEEEWVLDTFRQGGDIYCATASQMFHAPVEKHGRNAELRQKGKIAVLALGYGGAVGALDAMGGQRLGMTPEEEKDIVDKWRTANPHIVRFWRVIEKAVKDCMAFRKDIELTRLGFRMVDSTLLVRLPSGRELSYPRIGEAVNRFGKPSISFHGLNQETKKFERIETHGGKLTENIIQAVARDCLAHTMTLMRDAGYPIVFHVHDELICEVPEDRQKECLEDIQRIFSITPSWADGLPLKGAGYLTPYYKKD